MITLGKDRLALGLAVGGELILFANDGRPASVDSVGTPLAIWPSVDHFLQTAFPSDFKVAGADLASLTPLFRVECGSVVRPL